MNNHFLVILFDFTKKYAESDATNLEFQLKNTRINPSLRIFYLKIMRELKGIEKIDEYYEIKQNDAENIFELEGAGYDFRDGKSLKQCFEDIKLKTNQEFSADNYQKCYFICIGHGRGYDFFDNNYTGYTKSEYQKLNIDNTLYIAELIFAMNGVKFTLGIFNNCNTTLADNCYLFAKKFKYIIGTQNYTALAFLDLAIIIDYINRRITRQINSFEFFFHIFKSIVQQANTITQERPETMESLKDATLFLISLERFHNVFDDVDKLSLQLIEEYVEKNDLEWYKTLRPELTPDPQTYDYIDLFTFADKIQNLFPLRQTGHAITSAINVCILAGHVSDQTVNPYNGISIYLPALYQGVSKEYASYKDESGVFLKNFAWYKFMESVTSKLGKS